MMRYMRAFRAGELEDRQGVLTFVASTEGIKRDGKDLSAGDWSLDNYRRNPVFLWAHDYMGIQLPIGRADVEVEDSRLMASVTFDEDDDFARQVKRKYEHGFLNAVSVGWDETDDGLDLLDVSAVPVPGDPDALMERQFRALSTLREYAMVGNNTTHYTIESDGEDGYILRLDKTPKRDVETEDDLDDSGVVSHSRLVRGDIETLRQAIGLIERVLSDQVDTEDSEGEPVPVDTDDETPRSQATDEDETTSSLRQLLEQLNQYKVGVK